MFDLWVCDNAHHREGKTLEDGKVEGFAALQTEVPVGMQRVGNVQWKHHLRGNW